MRCFKGVSRELYIPMGAALICARENGDGVMFEPEEINMMNLTLNQIIKQPTGFLSW